jgi:hypothetical protein
MRHSLEVFLRAQISRSRGSVNPYPRPLTAREMRDAADGDNVAIDSWYDVHRTQGARQAPERGMLLVDAVLRRSSFALNPRPCYPGCVSRPLLFPLLREHSQWEAAVGISILATRHSSSSLS